MTRKNILILVLVAVFLLLGGTKFVPPNGGTDLPVLMYHDLCPDDAVPHRYAVTASRFREDMEWLKDHGYTTLTAAELVAAEETGKYPDKPVLVTFDDGYLSNYTIAYPILEELGMKATVCVIGELLDDDRDNYMTWKEAEVLQNSGVIDIQSHTYALHNFANGDAIWPPYGMGVYRLAGEDKTAYQSRFAADVSKMQERISAIGGKLILHAYPYGLCDPWSIEVLREQGIQVTLFTGGRFTRSNGVLYGLQRVEVTMERSVKQIFE